MYKQISNVKRTRNICGAADICNTYYPGPFNYIEHLSDFLINRLMSCKYIRDCIYYSAITTYQKIIFLMLILFSCTVSICAVALSGKTVYLSMIVLALLLVLIELNRRIYARAYDFEKDYATFLVSLASSVRGGQDPLIAFIRLRILFPAQSVLAECLDKAEQNLSNGSSEAETIRLFAINVRHPDVQLFRNALLLSRRGGSSIADCLHRLVKVTRRRQSFRRRMKSAVAMQKMSAFGIALSALAMSSIQFAANPRVIHQALAHPLASKIILMGSALIIIGVSWILYLSRARI